MAITQITEPATSDPINLSNGWLALLTKLTKITKGFASITINDYDDSVNDITIQSGSIFEDNGAYYQLSSNETPIGWNLIANSTQTYIIYSVANNQFEYVTGSPTWSDAKQGYYDGNDRYFYGVYKDGTGKYTKKGSIANKNDEYIYSTISYKNGIYTNGIKINLPTTYHLEGTKTENEIFDALKNFIPNIGDRILLNGAIIDADTLFMTTSYARRSTNVEILIGAGIYIISSLTTGIGEVIITDGSSSAYDIALSW